MPRVSGMRSMTAEVRRAIGWALLATTVLAVLIVLGSRSLDHFDAALVGYTFATLFAVFGITYRYAMWLQRPPTALYWRRGWQVFFRRAYVRRNLLRWPRHVINDFALNRFIWARGRLRWLAHWLILWGCVVAGLITFPLVFGWLYFDTVPGRPDWYRTVVFGFPTISFPADSLFAFLVFHGLVWSAFLVIGGVMVAMRRRMRDGGAAAVQSFAQDMLPLIVLFAISITGLLLTASYTWMEGYAYQFLAILHAVTVIFGLLWLPFGKFFHIFQRPAQLGVRFYKEVGVLDEPARCRRCGHAFTSRMKVEDLIETERRLGYAYEVPEDAAKHYQWICPRCRRALLALAQGRLWHGSRGAAAPPHPMPEFGNPGMGEGPLGVEDAANFHP
ncbi:MAG TPA: hypothetical protein VF158_08905 [Longimicrobiales bacterium]